MEIRTQWLIIRFVKPEDWKSLMEIWQVFSRSEYAQYDVPHPCDAETVREKAMKWAAVSPLGERIFFAVCLGEQMIGYVSCHKQEDSYDCGYCFRNGAHGRGYARESIGAIMEYLRDIWGARRCTAGTGLLNVPSIRLLTALGFQKLGEEKVSFYRDEAGNPIYFDGGLFEIQL